MIHPLAYQAYQTETYFCRAISQRYREIEGVGAAYMTGVEAAPFNMALIRQPCSCVSSFLPQWEAFFDQEKLPFVVIIPEHLYVTELAAGFKSNGYEKVDESVSMVLDFATFDIDSFEEFCMIQSMDHCLEGWSEPLVEAFGSPASTVMQYVQAHERGLERGFGLFHYSLCEGSQPVASLTLSFHGRLARMDDVGTCIRAQRRGHATKLMKYALREAQRQGASHCFLESSKAGIPLYQKLGFEPIGQHLILTQKRTSSDRGEL